MLPSPPLVSRLPIRSPVSLAPTAMAKQRFLLALLLVTALLALSFSQGLLVEARKVQVVRALRRHNAAPLGGRLLPEEMAYTTMDYGPPTANTNTHGGMIPTTPDPSSPPTH